MPSFGGHKLRSHHEPRCGIPPPSKRNKAGHTQIERGGGDGGGGDG